MSNTNRYYVRDRAEGQVAGLTDFSYTDPRYFVMDRETGRDVDAFTTKVSARGTAKMMNAEVKTVSTADKSKDEQGTARNDTVAQTEGKYRINHLNSRGKQTRRGPRSRFNKKADAIREAKARNKELISGEWVVEVRKQA